jgi:hypothetical protein
VVVPWWCTKLFFFRNIGERGGTKLAEAHQQCALMMSTIHVATMSTLF